MKGEEKLLLQSLIWGDHAPKDTAAFPGSQATLNSGDGLFIPRGWWHSIVGVGSGVTGSVSLNFLHWQMSAYLATYAGRSIGGSDDDTV